LADKARNALRNWKLSVQIPRAGKVSLESLAFAGRKEGRKRKRKS